MERPPLEVADVFRAHGKAYRESVGHHLSHVQLRAMRAIEWCRTAALGGHLEECDHCGQQRNAYNSCLNRNCPKCQSSAARRWLQERESELLEVPYFHVVFTVPKEIAALALGNQRVVYKILFSCVSKTLLQMGADPRHLGGQLGFLAILHTWGQNLQYHPHIHCVVVGGALQTGGVWTSCRKKYLLPVKVLSALFRGKLLAALNRPFALGKLKFAGGLSPLTDKRTFGSYLSAAAKKRWVVYCKPPFGGPQQVLHYLGRYTHRIAISNHRLVSLKDGQVTFRWRDYRDNNTNKEMTLPAEEFIRRFLMHIVPSRFVRIRHYGFLCTRKRTTALETIRISLGQEPRALAETAPTEGNVTSEMQERSCCPVCKIGVMKVVMFLAPVRPEDTS